MQTSLDLFLKFAFFDGGSWEQFADPVEDEFRPCSISVLSVVSTSSSEPAPSSSGERARGVDKADDDEQATSEHATGDHQADGNEQVTSEYVNDNLQTYYDEQANEETPATSVEIHGSL